jgi:hypothetical protein
MARPRLLPALTWPKFEQAVLAVFTEALRRLAEKPKLPQGEEPINLDLYWLCRDVHLEQLRAKKSIPFVIEFDSTNQPEPDDNAESRRLRKRPDFACAITDEQAPDSRSSQIRYSLECKRLGQAGAGWVLNKNYSEYGMLRFMQKEHGYAKGCSSAAMIGYVQNMDPDDILTEVNDFAQRRKIPSLSRAATAWAAKNVTQLSQDPLTRDFDTSALQLHHLWIDLRHCTFEKPWPSVP